MRGNGDGKTAPTLTAAGYRSSNYAPMVFDPNQITSRTNRSNPKPGDKSHTLPASENAPIAIQQYQNGSCVESGTMGTNQNASGRASAKIRQGMHVRRLLPSECEKLQGFSGTHTAITHRGKPACDGPRYKAIGNSWAVPVVSWIARRIIESEIA